MMLLAETSDIKATMEGNDSINGELIAVGRNMWLNKQQWSKQMFLASVSGQISASAIFY